MNSPNTHVMRVFYLFFLLFFSLIKLNAQCDPPAALPTTQCVNAPVTCLQDACYSTLNVPDFGWNGFCGPNTAIHNPQYFEIIPEQPCISILIHVDDCSSGNALQAALVTSCSWQPCPGGNPPCADVIDCDPGTGEGGTMDMSVCGLTPGVSIWLLLDGSNGALCQYTITLAEGIYEPQIDEELTSISVNPTSVCQGYDNLFFSVGPPITNAHGYIWNFNWGEVITTTLPELPLDVPDNTPAGDYEVCVLAFSGCDTTEIPVCIEFEVYEIDPEIKEPETFCPEEFPFSWGSVNISGPGDYEQTFVDPDGCFFDSLWTVDEYPDPPLGEVEIVHCLNENFDPYVYEGESFDQSGVYTFDYPGQGLNGCDSSMELTLTLIGLNAFIEHSCENGEFVLTAFTQEVIPGNATLEYEWYVNGTINGENTNTLYILCEDFALIECEVTVATPEGECVFVLDPYSLNCAADKPAPPDMGFADTLVCAQEVEFCVIEDPFGEPVIEYVWSGPLDVEVYQDGSECAQMDFSFTTGGEVCVYAINECGAGEPTCFNVEIIPNPIAEISHDIDVCVGTSTVITFTGSASPNAQFIWDFGNPANVTGSGAGPYTVTWNITGDKVISLQVIEPGCDEASTSGIITVSNFLPPTINCTSTINSVSFDWGDVTDACDYMISVNGGAPFSVFPNSEYMETGLAPGTMVNIDLTVVSCGPCPNIVISSSCTAQDCPPQQIDLSGPDSLCLNSPAIVTLQALVNGSPGTGMWSGPGIVNPSTGDFDPTLSGPGQHLLTYTVVVNMCPFSENYLMTVFDSITADFTVDPVICIDDMATVTYTGNASSGANYSFNFGGGTVLSGTGEGPYEIRYATPGAKTVRLQISENGCMSDIISKSLSVVAELNPPSFNCQPSTDGVNICWTTDPAASGFAVNTLTSQTGTTSGNCIDFAGLNPGDSVSIELVTQSAGPCPDIRDTFYCIAKDCPSPNIVITPVVDICLYPGTSTVDVEVTVTGGTGTGVGDWSGTGITNTVTGIFDPILAGPGAHQITYHFVDDGCDFNRSITIDVFDPPIAFISNTNLTLTCTSGSLTLDGSGSTGGNLSYAWSTSNGVFNGNTNQATANVTAEGVYELKVTDLVSGCVDSTTVTVMQDANAPSAKAGPDRIITCDTLSFTLGGASSTGPNITYLWTTPDGNIVGPDDAINVNVDKPGTYTIAVMNNSNGCTTYDAATVTIDTAVAAITLTPGDTIDCNTAISGVETALSGNVSDYNFQWSTSDGSIVGSSTNPDLDVNQGGTYTLTITNKKNGCERTASASVPESDEIINAVDVTKTNVICYGDNNGTLTINGVTGGTPPYTMSWSVNPGGGDLSNLGPGQYTLTVTDQNGCAYVQIYTITEPPKVTADVGPNLTVAAGDSVTIDLTTSLNINSTGSIDWSGYDGLNNCPGCPSLQFIATQSGTIVAIVTDTAGCLAADSMRLTVIVPRIIFIPSIFTPNNDGANDYFFIAGKPNLTSVNYMRVYDRWGNQLFDQPNLTPGVQEQGWDGKFRGQTMQPGVYVFVAELGYEDGFTEVIKGEVTLIK